jgi:hypothetical protein
VLTALLAFIVWWGFVVGHKGRGSVITRTNGAGIYKLPGFGKEVTPNNIVISCSKEGYKHTRSITRSAPSKTPLSAVEVLCTMQRITK